MLFGAKRAAKILGASGRKLVLVLLACTLAMMADCSGPSVSSICAVRHARKYAARQFIVSRILNCSCRRRLRDLMPRPARGRARLRAQNGRIAGRWFALRGEHTNRQVSKTRRSQESEGARKVSLHEPWMSALACWHQPRIAPGQVGGHLPTSPYSSHLEGWWRV
jgi:hypothetical protein